MNAVTCVYRLDIHLVILTLMSSIARFTADAPGDCEGIGSKIQNPRALAESSTSILNLRRVSSDRSPLQPLGVPEWNGVRIPVSGDANPGSSFLTSIRNSHSAIGPSGSSQSLFRKVFEPPSRAFGTDSQCRSIRKSFHPDAMSTSIPDVLGSPYFAGSSGPPS